MTSSQVKQNIDQNLFKIEILKKGLLEERKKKEDLEKENALLKEDVVIKQETIDKLKEEVLAFRDKSKTKQIQRFFNGLFEETTDEQYQQVSSQDENENLKQENEELRNQIIALENEKGLLNNKAEEYLNECNKLKEKYENIKKDLEKEFQEQINKITIENELKYESLQKQIDDKNKIISEQNNSIKCMSELCKSFDKQKFEYEKATLEAQKNLNEFKSTYDIKLKEVEILLKEQNLILQQLEERDEEISHLKNQINSFKTIIAEMTPININHVFVGITVPTEKYPFQQKVQMSFGKYSKCLMFKLGEEEEQIINFNDITNILPDKKSNHRVWVCLFIKGKQKNYLCDFSRKESEYIIKFYTAKKSRSDSVENGLVNVSLGNYFY